MSFKLGIDQDGLAMVSGKSRKGDEGSLHKKYGGEQYDKVRKTFEDCNSVRFLLRSLKLLFLERDVSMHMEFREELWRVLGGRTIPPRLFIKGRYIGGADEVLGLHEQGKLLPLVQYLPLDRSGGVACEGCGGVRFMMCSECSGSRKLYHDENVMHIQCSHCNENGLILCPICC